MTRAELLALAERVEKAAGADRELDAEIARTLLPHNAEYITRSRDGWSYRIFAGVGWDDEWIETRRYTASLDAAASLVPAGWAWCVHDVGVASAMRAPTIVKAQGATPALALTAAALRAMAAEARDA